MPAFEKSAGTQQNPQWSVTKTIARIPAAGVTGVWVDLSIWAGTAETSDGLLQVWSEKRDL